MEIGRFELRSSAANGGASPRLARTAIGAVDVRYVELAPAAPLAAHAKYELVAVRPSGAPLALGGFETGDASDKVPPVWGGVAAARYFPKGMANGSSCDTSSPYTILDIEVARDDMAAPEAIVYGVWRGPAPIDYAAPPETLVRARGNHLQLGADGVCADGTNLALTPPVHLGLRAIDLAGNARTPSEIDVSATPAPATSPVSTTPAPTASPAPPPSVTGRPRRVGCSVF